MFAEAIKETCFHLTFCSCERQKVVWNLFSNEIFPWCRSVTSLASEAECGDCAMRQAYHWVFHSVVPLFSAAVRIFSLLLRNFYRSSLRCFRKGGEPGWKEAQGEGQLAFLFHSLQQNCPRRCYEALQCIWELEIILTSWENCCERVSDCSTDFIVKVKRMLYDAVECYSSLSLIQAFKVEDSNLAISYLDKLDYYY